MANFETSGFRRASGSSLKELLNDTRTAKELLTPEELTQELWNELEGSWVGNKGWNIIALPSKGSKPTDQGDFFLQIKPYIETLSFKNAGAPARNRGGEVDQFVAALEYHQAVADKDTNEGLHVENGMFMNLSNIVNNQGDAQPIPKFNVARSGTIPHGDSIMLLGAPPTVVDGPPKFPEISSLPTNVGTAPLGYTDPYLEQQEGLNIINPNLTLQADLDQQKAAGLEVINTTTVVFDSANSGGILNIPFIRNFANAVSMQAIFWLEKVKDTKTGQVFDQLQYTQIIDLAFHKKFGEKVADDDLIIWPHVTINTMVKQ